ncbi:MAG: GNAT family N-acetyltransferase [Candidatus Marinimicrobia bacterium]|nr:GNAT family N-acetyltransferase [Candidatus Neomarinimicrobiota bacterium]
MGHVLNKKPNTRSFNASRSSREKYYKCLVGEGKKKTIKFGYLEVDNNNYGAIGLYREFGFREIGMRKNYYRENSGDAVIMMKELD